VLAKSEVESQPRVEAHDMADPWYPTAFQKMLLFCPLLPPGAPFQLKVHGKGAVVQGSSTLLTSYLLGAMKFKVSSGSYRMEKANSNTS
jgi:hypothetical protein